jgi:hypothetical protein
MSNGKPDKAVTVKIETVTPSMARKWLNGKVRNRELAPTWVKKLREQMDRGEFRLTWDALAFDKYGRLVNGQHRLEALAKLPDSASVQFVVIRGLNAKDYETRGDAGRKRSFKQVLAMRNEPDPAALAPATRYLWQNTAGFYPGARAQNASPPSRLLDEALSQHPKLRDHLSIGRELQKSASLGSPGLGTYLSYYLTRLDPEDGPEFFSTLIRQDFDGADDPAQVLWQMLVKADAQPSGHSKGFDVGHKAAWVIKAFNLWRLGQKIKARDLKWKRTEGFPLPDPPASSNAVSGTGWIPGDLAPPVESSDDE